VDADESALARRFAGGDPEAFDMVVARGYQTRVARLAQRLLGWVGEPEDVVQDVFLTALRKVGRISRTARRWWTWLATITVNRCRRQLRRPGNAMWRRFLFSSRHAATDAAVAADRDVLETETSRRVRESVAALPAARSGGHRPLLPGGMSGSGDESIAGGRRLMLCRFDCIAAVPS